MAFAKRIKSVIKAHLPQSVKVYVVNRNDKFLAGIDKEQRGLEIGASHCPIAPKKDGYCVETVDWLSQEELREHYKNDGVNLDAIEPVDYVWKGGSYYALICKENYYDYIIASHMIEHTTDFCGFLRDCARMLKPNGILRLAVPDKRYCFDHYRMVTELAEIVNNAYAPQGLQSPGMVAEYYLDVVARSGMISWDKPFTETVNCLLMHRYGKALRSLAAELGNWAVDALLGRRNEKYAFVHDDKTVLDNMKHAEKGEYVDIHHYVFTPASFELIIYDLRLLGMIDLKIAHMWETWGNEFIVTLQKTEEKPLWNPQYRKQLLRFRDKQNRI